MFWPTSEDFLATPVIDAMSLSDDGASYELKRVAWRDYDGIKITDNNYGSWSSVEMVEGTHDECFFPSIVNVKRCGGLALGLECQPTPGNGRYL